jgi:hypothetical protein
MKNVIAFEKKLGLANSELESTTETYSVEKLENLAMDVYKDINRDGYSFYLRRIMTKRREKLNNGFVWTDEAREKIIRLNETFFRAFKKAYAEALIILADMEGRIANDNSLHGGDCFNGINSVALIIEPVFCDTSETDSEIHEILLHANLSDYSRISAIEGIIVFDFELSPDAYLDDSTTGCKPEPPYPDQCLGKTFDGIRLSAAFTDLTEHGKWSFKDILSIKSLWTTIKIDRYFHDRGVMKK